MTSRAPRKKSGEAFSGGSILGVREIFAGVNAQRWPDGSPRYPVIKKGGWKSFIARYRRAVEELYAMRQSGHRLTPHCSICERAEQELIVSNEALEGLSPEDDANEELCRGITVRYDAAVTIVRELRRNGHHLDGHCDTCREAQGCVRELMNEGMLGFRSMVASYVNRVRTRTVNHPDLFIEGLLGVLDALVRFHPNYREGSSIPLLRFNEMGLEVWTVFEKLADDASDTKKNVDFPSYAYHSTRHAVQRSLANAYYSYVLRFPMRYHCDRQKILYLKWGYPGVRESPGEVFRRVCAAVPTMKERDIWDALSGFGRVYPLAKTSESSKEDVGTLFDPGTFQDAETAAYRSELFHIADGWIRYFTENRGHHTPMQQAILDYRFGFGGESKERLARVGKRMHLSRERARQVEEAMMAHHGLTSSDLWAIRMIYDAFHEEVRFGEPRLVPCMDLATGQEAQVKETMFRIVEGADHWYAMLAWAKSGHAHIVGSDVGAGRRSAEGTRQTVVLVSSPEALVRCLLREATIDRDGRFLVSYPEKVLKERHGLYPSEIEFVLNDLKQRGWIRFLTGMIPIIAIVKPPNTLTGSR